MRCDSSFYSLAGRTVLDSLMRDSCFEERASSSTAIRELIDMGAEFTDNTSVLDDNWTRCFDSQIYLHGRYKTSVPTCIPRFMIESMQAVTEFAEGKVTGTYDFGGY
jgi:hypothetical protein